MNTNKYYSSRLNPTNKEKSYVQIQLQNNLYLDLFQMLDTILSNISKFMF